VKNHIFTFNPVQVGLNRFQFTCHTINKFCILQKCIEYFLAHYIFAYPFRVVFFNFGYVKKIIQVQLQSNLRVSYQIAIWIFGVKAFFLFCRENKKTKNLNQNYFYRFLPRIIAASHPRVSRRKI